MPAERLPTTQPVSTVQLQLRWRWQMLVTPELMQVLLLRKADWLQAAAVVEVQHEGLVAAATGEVFRAWRLA